MVQYEVSMMIEVEETETAETLSAILRHIPSLNVRSLHLSRRASQSSTWGSPHGNIYMDASSSPSIGYPWRINATE